MEECVGFMLERVVVVVAVARVVSLEQFCKLLHPFVVDTFSQLEPLYVVFHALPHQHDVRTQQSLYLRDNALQALPVVQVAGAEACERGEVADHRLNWFHFLFEKHALVFVHHSYEAGRALVVAFARRYALHVHADEFFRK